MPGRMNFEYHFGAASRRPRDADDSRMRILLVGDWSGGAGVADLGRRSLLRVDFERFEEMMAKLAPRFAGLTFTTLDDFHPDQLLPRLRAAGRLVLPPPPVAPISRTAPAGEEDTLARLLGEKLPASPASRGSEIDALLRDAVAEHIVPAPDPASIAHAADSDRAAAAALRAVLHHPGFQRLEAAWRALHRLVSGADAEDLTFTLLDATQSELAADLAEPATAQLPGRLADANPPWSLIAVDAYFGPAEPDLQLLAALGALASSLGAPLIAAADPRVDWTALAPEDEARWRALRGSPQAGALGLALPRWLLRLPYSPTEPIDAFAFDELETLDRARAHEAYLWGNPAFACALLGALAFAERGAEMQLGDVRDLADLPCHTYREDGESRMQACAEVYLPERRVEALLARGLIPLVSARDRSALRVPRFQSIADPPTPLK